MIPGSGRSPGERNGYPLQYSCLVNSECLCLWIYLFSIEHISDLLCLHSFTMACISILFHFMAEKYSNICICHNLFTHLSVYTLRVLWTVLLEALVYRFFNYFWCIPRNRIADQMIILCLLFWWDTKLFFSDFTILHSQQQCMKALSSLHLHQIYFPLYF